MFFPKKPVSPSIFLQSSSVKLKKGYEQKWGLWPMKMKITGLKKYYDQKLKLKSKF